MVADHYFVRELRRQELHRYLVHGEHVSTTVLACADLVAPRAARAEPHGADVAERSGQSDKNVHVASCGAIWHDTA